MIWFPPVLTARSSRVPRRPQAPPRNVQHLPESAHFELGFPVGMCGSGPCKYDILLFHHNDVLREVGSVITAPILKMRHYGADGSLPQYGALQISRPEPKSKICESHTRALCCLLLFLSNSQPQFSIQVI